MSPVPATKFNELLGKINALSEEEVSEFTLARFRSEAEKLKSSNPAEAFLILGIVECLAGNEEACKSNHQRAMQLDNRSIFKINFANSMQCLSNHEEAFKYWKLSFEEEPGELDVLDSFISSAFATGRFFKGRALLTEWTKRAVGKTHTYHKILHSLADVEENLQLNDMKLAALTKEAWAFMRKSGYKKNVASISPVLSPDGVYIRMHILVSESIEKIAKLSFDLAMYLAENVDELFSDKFVIRIVEDKDSEHNPQRPS